MEMTGRGKPGKPEAGFPLFRTALGNRRTIPTFPQARIREMMNRPGAPARLAALAISTFPQARIRAYSVPLTQELEEPWRDSHIPTGTNPSDEEQARSPMRDEPPRMSAR
jgi:hypothetical protein